MHWDPFVFFVIVVTYGGYILAGVALVLLILALLKYLREPKK